MGISAILLILPALGIAYTLLAIALAGRATSLDPGAGPAPSVTILKPLHGYEPRLAGNLRSVLEQDYAGAIQLVCGVADASDKAVPVAHEIADEFANAELVIDGQRLGTNPKIANLVNMSPRIAHEVIVQSDSDIAVASDYLRRIVIALSAPGVGAVSCLYSGRGDTGGWSRMAAAGINWQFLPSVLVGIALCRANPCMGSTIAMRRETLDAIGGFGAFADRLADDHAIGEAARGLGLKVAIPATLVTHGCSERSLAALLRHEVRWAVTIRGLDPLGHAGSVVTHPFPLALLLWGAGVPFGGWTVLATLATRLLLAIRYDSIIGRRTTSYALVPVRDLIGFGVFLASLVTRRVDWRGRRLDILRGDRIAGSR